MRGVFVCGDSRLRACFVACDLLRRKQFRNCAADARFIGFSSTPDSGAWRSASQRQHGQVEGQVFGAEQPDRHVVLALAVQPQPARAQLGRDQRGRPGSAVPPRDRRYTGATRPASARRRCLPAPARPGAARTPRRTPSPATRPRGAAAAPARCASPRNRRWYSRSASSISRLRGSEASSAMPRRSAALSLAWW